MSKIGIKQAALSGFTAASAYNDHRPSYPAEAVEQLLSAMNISGNHGAIVADLGAGTGKFSELLAARPEQYSVVAIEPHDAMRAELECKNMKGVRIVKGMAEDMSGIANGSFDALIASQAFHWFANRSALKEIHRVLKATGALGMIWNVEDYIAPLEWSATTKWESTIRGLTWSFDDEIPRFRHKQWRKCFDDQLASSPLRLTSADPLFSLPLGEGTVAFETWLSKDDVWERYKTLSQIAVLGGDKLEEVKRAVFYAINQRDVLQDDRGRVVVHGQTFFAWTSRIPEHPLRNDG